MSKEKMNKMPKTIEMWQVYRDAWWNVVIVSQWEIHSSRHLRDWSVTDRKTKYRCLVLKKWKEWYKLWHRFLMRRRWMEYIGRFEEIFTQHIQYCDVQSRINQAENRIHEEVYAKEQEIKELKDKLWTALTTIIELKQHTPEDEESILERFINRIYKHVKKINKDR